MIMRNTKKLLPTNLAANQVVVAVQEAATNVFAANMNVLHVARDQGRKVWVALGATAGELAEQNLKLLRTTVAAANDKSVAAWEAVEQALEQRVLPVLDKVGLAAPAQYGVDLLGRGVHRVSAQVVELTRVRSLGARRPVRKPAAKKVVARRRARPAAKLAA
jgi:hypothetical protein